MKRRNISQNKTRILGVDYGKEGTLKYFASSSSAYNYESWTPEYAMAVYDGGMRKAGTVTGANWPVLGRESITTVSGRRGVCNNCNHIKQRVVNLPFLLAYWRYNISNWTRYSQEYLLPYWRVPMYGTYYTDAANVALSHGLVNDQMFSARAYWSMRPKLQSSVSLINSIFELKDFSDAARFLASPKGLWRLIAGDRLSFKSLYRAIGNGHKFRPPTAHKKGYRALRDYVHSKSVGSVASDITKHSTQLAASGTLTYNLAYLPTVRDAIAIHAESQKNVLEQLQNFEAYGDAGSTSHFSEEETLYTSVTPGASNNYIYGTGKLIRRKRTATMTSYYRTLWKRFEDMYPKWWGLEVGADEVWNMLPLSFVLDYVLTVGKSLEYMDRDPRIEVLGTEYCESIKVTAELGTFIIQSYRTPQLIIDGLYLEPRRQSKCHLVSGTCGSYYTREVMEPYKGPALPKLKLPSATQSANMLALARCLLF